jgi:hypothetical protein
VLLWRLSIIREVLLSGFRLELYVEDEKSFVYWELSQVIHEHLGTLDALEPIIPKGELVPKPAVSVLNLQPISRYRSVWRTYLPALISQRLPVTLHGNVHGRFSDQTSCAPLTELKRCSFHYRLCDSPPRVSHSTLSGGTNGHSVPNMRDYVLR